MCRVIEIFDGFELAGVIEFDFCFRSPSQSLLLSPFLSFTLANLHPSRLAFQKHAFTHLQRVITSSTSNPAVATTRPLPTNPPLSNPYSTLNHHLTNPIIRATNSTIILPSTRAFWYSKRNASSTQPRPSLTPAEEAEILSEASSSYYRPRVKPLFSIRRQTAAEGEWLQDNVEDPSFPNEGPSRERFDWRQRATSRQRAVVSTEASSEQKPYRRRIRPAHLPLVEGAPFYDEYSQYSAKYVIFPSVRLRRIEISVIKISKTISSRRSRG